MRKKSVLVLILLIIFTNLYFIDAADDKEVEKAYSCLKDYLGSNCGGTSNTFQLSFNLLASAHDSSMQSSCKSALIGNKNNDCWGDTTSGACTLKDTALALIALEKIDTNAQESLDWLLSKRMTKTGLTWYLEIDSDNFTECDINGRKIMINENKKITGQDPVGLVKTYNGYWYEITDVTRNYTISCNKDFKSTILYKKPQSNVLFVPNKLNMASGGDKIVEKVNAYCFSLTTECDYEGSLWSALALAKLQEDITPYIPYLSAMSEETNNKKYFPSAFLYMLTGSDDYYANIVALQQQNKYWLISNRKLYDTSIALLALQDPDVSGSAEATNARNDLLSQKDTNGCWDKIYHSMILYSGWPKSPTSPIKGGSVPLCRDSGFYCVSSTECKIIDQLANYDCSGGYVCCNSEPDKETCEEKEGFICNDDEECSGSTVPSQDSTSCCIGACQLVEDENDCDIAGGTCRTSCLDSEQDKGTSYSSACSFQEFCCEKKPVDTSKNYKWLLILLLAILIILVILAIVFRNQLKIWWFKVKSKFKSGKGPDMTRRPPTPPPGYRPQPRPMMARPPVHMYGQDNQRRVMQGQKSDKDREFEETMKKLRDMSK
ncbi:MAG: hypothetical protein WC867_02520 [Candidatus Pacearchaeota archaeon]|jgi:hypothetical protein